MRIGTGVFVVLLGAVSGLPAAAAHRCPAGTYMIMDTTGREQCEPVGAKPAAVSRALNGGCPAGSRPWGDFYGNNVCRSEQSLSGIGRPSGIQQYTPPGPARTPGPPGQVPGLN
jgi:hypothetical protein